jgi:hypothetical protein
VALDLNTRFEEILGLLGLRPRLSGFRQDPLQLRHQSLRLVLPVPALDDDVQGEARDDDEQ